MAKGPNKAVDSTPKIAIEDILTSATVVLIGMNRLELVTTLEETILGIGM